MAEVTDIDSCKDSHWQDLIIAMLAVNQYSLEKTYPLVTSLRQTGLFDPAVLSQLDCHEVEARLRAGGCDRGEFMTALFAKRLVGLGTAIRTRGVGTCDHVLQSGDPGAIGEFLTGVYGIGPKVIGNYLFLRGLKSRP